MRFFLHLAYDGSKYSGWQWQPNAHTVQGALEETLGKVLKQKISVHGCGRTDKGVHASSYYAHFDLEEKPNFDLVEILGLNLPKSITVFDFFQVDEKNSSQADAISRTYRYKMHTQRDPFIVDYSTYVSHPEMDIVSMQKAAQVIEKFKDFRSVCLQPDIHNHTNCTIFSSEIKNTGDGKLEFVITADRFLKGMIRILAAHLINIGKKDMTLQSFTELFHNPSNRSNNKQALPNGLYLEGISYSFF